MEDYELIHALTKARDIVDAAFIRAVMESEYDDTHTFVWNTKSTSLACLNDFIASESQKGRQRAVSRMNECIISFELSADGHFQGRIAGPYDDVHSGIQRLKELLPESIQEEQSIQYSFWRSHTLGARETRRNLFVPGWEDIEANYALKTRASLTRLMGRDEPINSGGLMLWHGLPGTGKSYAVRALSWEWRSWSRFNYGLDSDRFRRDTGYMFNALMDARSDKRAIFVVDDAGDLLTLTNGARDGLSALLNVTDGAVGQGMRTMFLFTTNLPLARSTPRLREQDGAPRRLSSSLLRPPARGLGYGSAGRPRRSAVK